MSLNRGGLWASGPSMDWPLSREEKKGQLLRLYSRDMQASDEVLSSGGAALQALREELEAVRRTAGSRRAKSGDEDEDSLREKEVERLRMALESASAVLRAIVPMQDDAGDGSLPDSAMQTGSRLRRARSEGCATVHDSGLRPSLSRTPRQSRGGTPRRVSFGDKPEQHLLPAHEATEVQPDTLEPEPELEGESVVGKSSTTIRRICLPTHGRKAGIGFKPSGQQCVVAKVTEGSWAQEMGVLVGDLVIAVGGIRVDRMTWPQFSKLMEERPLHLEIERR
eukprot:gnl/TRDRNA2_/TRDRNA2_189082_c0_seq1.p1 gnl/TRDRNA2_/TRDRNA2_189082_c0~~gnl/TRDRNA2_/TRDRNA2_189082_c0_seq1.p1  ORF type:complete len:305 (+),score=53.84 gnl/TRDRNA2_/TRDRNA2_189082_c0_seq1:78-917(+)